MTLFTDLGLAEPVLRAVAAESYTTPTPIQAKAIPIILEGHDMVGIAQTGTGKTAAFVLPLLHRLANDVSRPADRTCRILILAPTRELVQQIAESARTYGKFVRPSIAVVIGGAKHGPQAKQMLRGVDLLVATPGRLLDHMGTGAIRLDQTTTVVLDEADQMLDMGFIPAIRQILARLPSTRQTMLLSATMPKPIRALASEFLANPREIAVSAESRPIERIDQQVILLSANDKRAKLVELLAVPEMNRAIVFTRTKHGADKVTQHLEAAGLPASAIHGNKSQPQRERALDWFRAGRVKILVATDIAARGIDVDGVSHIINFELPNMPESYVHRIGRTARAGATGIAISLCEPTELAYLRDIERLIGRELIPGGVPHGVKRPPQNRGGQNRGGDRNNGGQHRNDNNRSGQQPRPAGQRPAGRGAQRGRHAGGGRVSG